MASYRERDEIKTLSLGLFELSWEGKISSAPETILALTSCPNVESYNDLGWKGP